MVESIAPIIAVYYNDADYWAIDNLKNISFKFLIIMSIIFTGVMFLFPDLILTIFSVNAQYSAIVTNEVRLYEWYFILLGFVFFYIFYTQSIQKNKVSNIVSIFFNLILVLVMLLETNDKLDTIDVLLDGDDSIKIYIKDLGNERKNNFTFKNNDFGFLRTFDKTWVLGLNSTVITIKN